MESPMMFALQDDLETKALRLLSHPAILRARRDGEERLIASLPNATPESHAIFKTAMDELTYFGIMNGLNDDPAYPRVTVVQRPARHVGGQQTPAPKGLDENPDTVYRIVPMDGASTYILSGQVVGHRPQVVEFSLLGDDWFTVGNVSGETLEVASDGRFTITVAPEPADGRTNYIQTRAGASFMVVRDTIADWKHQRATRLAVARTGGPSSQPRSEAEEIRSVVAKINRFFFETIRLHELAFRQPANVFPQPLIRSEYGMLVTQAYSIGHFALEEGEALVLSLQPGGAGYLTVPVTTIWGTTRDPVHRMSSLNSLQAEPNPDGSFTFVVSVADHGFRNWIDPEGVPEGLIFLRWAAIEGERAGGTVPAVEAKVLAIDDLFANLPTRPARIDQEWRRRQLDQRARDYDRRWLDQ
ncbi:MAG: hypothetical protein JWM91_2300 [Rhodospirillales bacterium]|nr:hypothetical protein [Rhodospirillales bacterium]